MPSSSPSYFSFLILMNFVYDKNNSMTKFIEIEAKSILQKYDKSGRNTGRR